MLPYWVLLLRWNLIKIYAFCKTCLFGWHWLTLTFWATFCSCSLVLYLCSLAFYSCSLVFYSCSLVFLSCSLMLYLCSILLLVFNLCSLVFQPACYFSEKQVFSCEYCEIFKNSFLWNTFGGCFYLVYRSNITGKLVFNRLLLMNFISNAILKLAKNQANIEQHPEAELLLFENYLKIIHVIIQKY